MEMSVYYLALLRKGPTWTAEESPELAALTTHHLAYLNHLQQLGKTLASGPVGDEGDIRGISLYRTTTLAEARSLAEADPAVQAGRFVLELHEWWMPAGLFPAPESA
jgi:uncharacterized protein YciI